MIITKAEVLMAAAHDYRKEQTVTEKLDFNLSRKPAAENLEQSASISQWSERVSISTRGQVLAMNSKTSNANSSLSMNNRDRLNLMILQRFFKTVTGHDVSLFDPSNSGIELQTPINENNDSTNSNSEMVVTTPATPAPVVTRSSPRIMQGLVYERHTRTRESEQLQFNAQGTIRTQDGRSISFDAGQTMSRNFVTESNLIIGKEPVKKIDPLIINFDGKGAVLGANRMQFDLDNNGVNEQIATLGSGSGFLALDSNNDGTINNGSELFGPDTGRGFAELAVYDEDNNHFIDEGDAIYEALSIWQQAEDGTSRLFTLKDKNIGAIFLGNVDTQFQLNDVNNNSLGSVVRSGIYIAESGQVGVVQEIDLHV